jgi:hypothetical protein
MCLSLMLFFFLLINKREIFRKFTCTSWFDVQIAATRRSPYSGLSLFFKNISYLFLIDGPIGKCFSKSLSVPSHCHMCRKTRNRRVKRIFKIYLLINKKIFILFIDQPFLVLMSTQTRSL